MVRNRIAGRGRGRADVELTPFPPRSRAEDQMWGKCKLIVCALIVFFAIFVLYIVSKRAAD